MKDIILSLTKKIYQLENRLKKLEDNKQKYNTAKKEN